MEQQLSIVWNSINQFAIELGQFLPKLIGAVVILVLGWLIAKLVYFVVTRGLKGIGFGVVTDKAGLDSFLKKGGVRQNTIEVLGLLVYWLVILVTLLTTFNVLGLTVVSDLFSRVAQFVPNVIVSVLILAIGLYFARFVADAISTYTRNVGIQDADLVGRVTYYAIAIFVVLLSLGQMGIGDMVFQTLILYTYGGVVLAFALAFGLGGQKWAADKLEKFSKKK